MGKVYDLAKQEICEIENEVQKDLDKFSAGGIRFKIDITSEKTLELIFTRQYRDGEIDWLNYDSKTIYCTAYSGGYPFSISGDIRSVPS